MVRMLTKHLWVMNLLFIAATAWLVANLISVVIRNQWQTYPKTAAREGASSTPVEKSEPYERYAPIPERNIFNPTEKGLRLLPLAEKKSTASAGNIPEGTKSTAAGSYRLIGTVTAPGIHSYAIIQEGTDRKQQIYRLHEYIGDGEIVRVSRNQIIIKRGQQEEELSIFEEELRPQTPPSPATSSGEVVKKLSANRFLVNREDVTASVGNINQFMTQARFKPHFVLGRPSGFSVSEIKPGSLMEKLGLRNNDVIKKVNGQMVTKPEEVFQAYSQLQRDSNIEVEIERGDRSEIFRYEIR